LLIPVFAAIGLYYFMILRPERRKQQNVQSRLEALKKNDRVVTIGGIYGVVVNVNRESDEVTLKIDEATNAKMRVTIGAVARILGEDSADKSANS
jgi:preprotein translocase subunit YajC